MRSLFLYLSPYKHNIRTYIKELRTSTSGLIVSLSTAPNLDNDTFRRFTTYLNNYYQILDIIEQELDEPNISSEFYKKLEEANHNLCEEYYNTLFPHTDTIQDLREIQSKHNLNFNKNNQQLFRDIKENFEQLLTKLNDISQEQPYILNKAAPVAEELLNNIKSNIDDLSTNVISLDMFFTKCENAIEKARPVLANHENISIFQIIRTTILSVLLAIPKALTYGVTAGIIFASTLLTSLAVCDLIIKFSTIKNYTEKILDEVLDKNSIEVTISYLESKSQYSAFEQKYKESIRSKIAHLLSKVSKILGQCSNSHIEMIYERELYHQNAENFVFIMDVLHQANPKLDEECLINAAANLCGRSRSAEALHAINTIAKNAPKQITEKNLNWLLNMNPNMLEIMGNTIRNQYSPLCGWNKPKEMAYNVSRFFKSEPNLQDTLNQISMELR